MEELVIHLRMEFQSSKWNDKAVAAFHARPPSSLWLNQPSILTVLIWAQQIHKLIRYLYCTLISIKLHKLIDTCMLHAWTKEQSLQMLRMISMSYSKSMSNFHVSWVPWPRNNVVILRNLKKQNEYNDMWYSFAYRIKVLYVLWCLFVNPCLEFTQMLCFQVSYYTQSCSRIIPSR